MLRSYSGLFACGYSRIWRCIRRSKGFGSEIMVKAMFENYTNVVTTVQPASSLILQSWTLLCSVTICVNYPWYIWARHRQICYWEAREHQYIHATLWQGSTTHTPFIGRINSTSVAALPPSPTIKASMSDWFHSFVVHIHHRVRKTILTSWFIGAIARFAMPAHGNNSFGFINRNQRRPERHLQIAHIPLPIIPTKLKRCSGCRL